MESDFPNSIALLENAVARQLYQKLILQLIKDFELAGTPINPNLEISPMDLVYLVREKIYRLIMEDFDVYVNLLYIADIPESELKDLEENDAVDMSNEVSFLLLKRIWKKVWYRERYS